MASVKFSYDDSQLRELLRNAKDKKVYRRCANDTLEDLKQSVSQATHYDHNAPDPHMQDVWEVSPLKMRDGGYSVFGELTNSSTKSWQKESYASYEIGRGGSHDAIAIGLDALENTINDFLGDALEGLLK